MTDNYSNMKEILKLLFLIVSSQIIYDHMEISINFFIYLFICQYLFDT